MPWGTYYRQVAIRSATMPWSLTRQISTAASLIIGSLIFTVLIFPPVKPYLTTWGWARLGDFSSLAAVSLLLFFLAFVAIRFFFYVPYQMHEEQEQKIEGLNRTLRERARLQAQCDTIANLIDEGTRIR